MREILFRGKRVDDRKWVYGYYFFDEKSGMHFIKPSEKLLPSYEPILIDSEAIGQYTGREDKNGNKIFDGDIMIFESDILKNTTYEEKIQYVYWDDDEDKWEGLLNASHHCEIIGNKTDNPELMEKIK
jgi:uncharacterized phage protein (TIGR01671 family)